MNISSLKILNIICFLELFDYNCLGSKIEFKIETLSVDPNFILYPATLEIVQAIINI